MNRGQCLILWGAAALLTVPHFIKDRRNSATETPAVLFYSPTAVVVRVSGNIEKPGIYALSRGATLESVTKMTMPGCAPIFAPAYTRNTPLTGGEVVNVAVVEGNRACITLGILPAWERIPLGLPLDPDILTETEWEYLPRIGPRLAHNIILDRQINGGFGRLEALERVSGIGPATLRRLKSYF